jgi:type 1 glutamine amidotransferase
VTASAWQWPTREQFERADVLMFNCWNHNWSAERYRELDAYLARGGGIVLIHAACIADRDPESLAKRVGLAAQPKRTKYRHGPLELTVNAAAADHPITRGFRAARFVDETYWPLIGDAKDVTVLATADEEGHARPMLWTFETGPGRVFGSVLGHYTWTTDDPLFRALVLRGTAWAAGHDVRRLESLAVPAGFEK